MSKRMTNAERVLTRKAWQRAVVTAIEQSRESGYDLPLDVATAIEVQLDKVGLKIVRKPGALLDVRLIDQLG